jgi:hypothetical protein
MPQLLDRASPVMRRCTGLDADQARFELCEEGLGLRATKLATEGLLTLGIDAIA